MGVEDVRDVLFVDKAFIEFEEPMRRDMIAQDCTSPSVMLPDHDFASDEA
jgi:hypothetical protein